MPSDRPPPSASPSPVSRSGQVARHQTASRCTRRWLNTNQVFPETGKTTYERICSTSILGYNSVNGIYIRRSVVAFSFEVIDGIGILTIPVFSRTGLVKHAFTTRHQGFSQAPYASLNLGLHVGDGNRTVIENRRQVCAALELDFSGLVAAQQVHGERVAVIKGSDGGKGAMNYDETIPATDALITNCPGIPLSAYFADCVPLMILDPVVPAIGLAHAGWKGTVLRIGAKTIKMMEREYGTRPKDCLVGIGPSIGPCCYEVGEQVLEEIKSSYVGWRELVRELPEERWMLNLWLANSISLMESGVPERNLYFSDCCTSCRTDLFFSYRAEGGRTGRMAALIMLEDGDGKSGINSQD
ncbi:MAG TPA: peptidoglycan editing factor PgeF [Clostridia bacterium]|nr:peptidoglycan editing factor PgeF [Clostridia bacterium]